MRQTFIKTLTKLAAEDDRILLLTADLGYTVLEPFIEKFPNRFLNVGVAEQNLVGMATGLAEAGFIPFLYSIVTFATLRPFEFIRNGPIVHQLPIRIVGIGGGFEYGYAGKTHHGLEDLGVLRTQPGLKIMAPADYQQTQTVLEKTWHLPGPVYYRLGKDEVNTVPGLNGDFALEKGQLLGEGNDLLLVTTGSITSNVVTAAQALKKDNIDCKILVVSSINPPPVADLVKILSKFRLVMTVEEHYLVGGLGSLVAEIIAEAGLKLRLVRCGVKETLPGITGSQKYYHQQQGLSPESLAKTAKLEWFK